MLASTHLLNKPVCYLETSVHEKYPQLTPFINLTVDGRPQRKNTDVIGSAVTHHKEAVLGLIPSQHLGGMSVCVPPSWESQNETLLYRCRSRLLTHHKPPGQGGARVTSDSGQILLLGFLVTCVAQLEQDGGILRFFILFLEVPALTNVRLDVAETLLLLFTSGTLTQW